MHSILLLRGINVGGNHKVEMKRLKAFLESLGCTNVTTYLNSGNALFESPKKLARTDVEAGLKKEFGFEIPTLIKSAQDMHTIAATIPTSWQNDTEQKTDVAYLFNAIDTPKTLDELPFHKEFVTAKYVPGAIIWNVSREHYTKSRLDKLIQHKYYKLMTVRNVNTARFLGGVGK